MIGKQYLLLRKKNLHHVLFWKHRVLAIVRIATLGITLIGNRIMSMWADVGMGRYDPKKRQGTFATARAHH